MTGPMVRTVAAAARLGALAAIAACAEGDADGAPPGGAGRGGGRGAPTVVLAQADVHSVARGAVETTSPLSGDLRPIEEIVVRARVEGDLVRVLVREGDPVVAGSALATFDTVELAAARTAAVADVAAAQGDSVRAEWELQQSRELFQAGAIAEQALRAAEQTALAARARVAAARARQASADVAMRDARVVAPAAGTVSERFVESGERVTRGAPLFTVVRDDSLEFTAALPARAASIVRVGQEVRFTVEDRQLTGRIARVSPAVDPASRSFAVYVRVANRDRALKANTFASGLVVADRRDEVIVLPLDAVRRSREGSAPFVYRVDGDRIEVAAVGLGVTDEARSVVEVTAGVAVGDRVVVGNVGTIGSGMRVQILDADQDAAGRGAGPAGRGRGTRGGTE